MDGWARALAARSHRLYWRGGGVSTGAMIQLTLYTRAECPLCHEMRAVIEEVARGIPFTLELVDVEVDPTLAAAYGDEVPVLAINGRRAFAARVDPAALRARLARES